MDNSFISIKGEEGVLVPLDCRPCSTLHWNFSQVEKLIAEGKKISFALSFGLYEEETNFHEEALFAARRYALQYLQKNFLLPYQGHILSLLFYQGSFDFTPSLRKFANLALLYKEYAQDVGREDNAFLRKLFSIKLLMNYLHRLSAALTAEIFSFVLLQMDPQASPAALAQFLSKDHFPYIYPGSDRIVGLLEGVGWKMPRGLYGYVGPKANFAMTEEPTVGIALPAENRIEYLLVEQLIEKLEREGTPFRLFPERLFVESWGGLEKIYVFPTCMEAETVRRIQGFIAAEGVVEEVRGRGIRTPDLLVPNQTR